MDGLHRLEDTPMTIALWAQLIVAFTLLGGVCFLARRPMGAGAAPEQAVRAQTAKVVRLAA